MVNSLVHLFTFMAIFLRNTNSISSWKATEDTAFYRNSSSYKEELEAIAAIASVIENVSAYNSLILPHKATRLGKRIKVTEITPIVGILRVSDLSDKNEFFVDMFFTQKWWDPRIPSHFPGNITRVHLRGEMMDRLWLPDTIVRNSQDSRLPDVSQRDNDHSILIHPGGEVEYTIRLSTTCSCQVNLVNFPFDYQTCHVVFGSLSYVDFELIYVEPLEIPITVFVAQAVLPGLFHLEINNSACSPFSIDYQGEGKYSSFCIQLEFQRDPTPFILRSFLPAIMLVLSSWISFYIDHKCVPARIFISTTLLLAVGRIETEFGQTTAEGVYQLSCYTFVFVSLVEFGIVHFIASRSKYSSEENTKNHSREVSCPTSTTCYHLLQDDEISVLDSDMKKSETDQQKMELTQMGRKFTRSHRYRFQSPTTERRPGYCKAERCSEVDQPAPQKSPRETVPAEILSTVTSAHHCRAHKVDVVARFLFPVLFAVYNLVFWGVVLKRR